MHMLVLPLHEILHVLAWLEGTWITEEPGVGMFPTVKPFNYYEEINITSIGQPMFNYIAQSWHSETGMPLHRETGFLHVFPETNKVALYLVNPGFFTIEEGDLANDTIDLKSTDILITEAVKPLTLTKTHRIFKLNNDHLEQVFYMATANTPELTEHLRTKYKKVT